jgi:outer membrane protein assembly factor BamD (BamD/ComL family)
VPEALAIMIKSYEALGIKDLAADTRKVFERNFPNQIAMLEQRGEFSEQAN